MSTWCSPSPELVPWTAAPVKASPTAPSPASTLTEPISQMWTSVSTTWPLKMLTEFLIQVSLLTHTSFSIDSSMTNSAEVETLAIQPQKLLILDARSYAAAVANRAKGGGCECPGTLSQVLLQQSQSNKMPHSIMTCCSPLQSTTLTVRWCLWVWPTSIPSARVSSLCASSAHKCLIQPSKSSSKHLLRLQYCCISPF